MTRRPGQTRARLTLPLFVLLFFVTGIAGSETFRGALTSQTTDPQMPIVIDLENADGRLSGAVTISSSPVLEGPIISGEQSGYSCEIISDLGGGVIMRMTGTCTGNVLVGRYVMRFPNARPRQGIFRLVKSQSDSKAKPKIEKKPKTEEQSEDKKQSKRFSATECLKMNTACLGACPRGDYNSEFLCTNSCKRKLTACRAKGKDAAKSPSLESDKSEPR